MGYYKKFRIHLVPLEVELTITEISEIWGVSETVAKRNLNEDSISKYFVKTRGGYKRIKSDPIFEKLVEIHEISIDGTHYRIVEKKSPYWTLEDDQGNKYISSIKEIVNALSRSK